MILCYSLDTGALLGQLAQDPELDSPTLRIYGRSAYIFVPRASVRLEVTP